MLSRSLLLALAGVTALPACRSTTENSSSPPLSVGNPAYRSILFAPLLELDGRWRLEGTEDWIEFDASSSGTALREVMFPGQPHEMTNMYTLDGDSIVMTHYCAVGNQPRMRADVIGDGQLVFQFDGITDLGTETEEYMGEMTLVWTGEDRLEQHWRSFQAGKRHPESDMSFELVREE